MAGTQGARTMRSMRGAVTVGMALAFVVAILFVPADAAGTEIRLHSEATAEEHMHISMFKEKEEETLDTETFVAQVKRTGKFPQWMYDDPDMAKDIASGLLTVEDVTKIPEGVDEFMPGANDRLEKPKLYTIGELMRMVHKKKRSELIQAELVIFHTTNAAILNGEEMTLIDALKGVEELQAKLFTEKQARNLDKKPAVYSPIESEALSVANQKIAMGETTTLEKEYGVLLLDYQKAAYNEALTIYKAIKGMGTDEDAIMAILDGKSLQQIDSLSKQFRKVLALNKEDLNTKRSAAGRRIHGSNKSLHWPSLMYKWIFQDTRGGWREKLLDALEVRPVKPDTHYFWSHKVAKEWSDGMKQYVKDMQLISKYSDSAFMKGFADLSIFAFDCVTLINKSFENAVVYYSNKIDQSSGAVRVAYMVCHLVFVLCVCLLSIWCFVSLYILTRYTLHLLNKTNFRSYTLLI